MNETVGHRSYSRHDNLSNEADSVTLGPIKLRSFVSTKFKLLSEERFSESGLENIREKLLNFVQCLV